MSKNINQLIEKIKEKAKDFYFKKDGTPYDDIHDWSHMSRVYGACEKILEFEPKANRAEVLIAAIMHDTGRSLGGGEKNHAELSYKIAKDLFVSYKKDFTDLQIDSEKVLLMIKYHTVAHICPDKKIASALEFNILTDADKIDMFGPSGVLRVPIATAYLGQPTVLWAANRLLEQSKDNNFYFQSEGGKKVGQKYKDYLKKFIKDLNEQNHEFGADS